MCRRAELGLSQKVNFSQKGPLRLFTGREVEKQKYPIFNSVNEHRETKQTHKSAHESRSIARGS